MNEEPTGADTIVGALADGGVTVCFANPGTSEMQLVSALQREPRIRSILCLFEGVATGAADGYARIAGKPAMTLLHLGPGYSNGAANIHNARRAFSPMINIVGDHATTHAACDAPLASDIAGIARASSIEVATLSMGEDPRQAVAGAVRASGRSPPGPVTLIVPADCAWSAAPSGSFHLPKAPRTVCNKATIKTVRTALRASTNPALLLGGNAVASSSALQTAAQLHESGIAIYADTFLARHRRGCGLFAPIRLPYFAEDARSLLGNHDLLLLAGAASPVPFFAYPNTSSRLLPDDCQVVALRGPGESISGILEALAEERVFGGTASGVAPELERPDAPAGPLSPSTIGSSLAHHMKPGTVVSDDAVTASGSLYAATAGASEHDWLSLTGGAIGQALPVAIGAAIARPEARVIAVTGDGAAMYTPQALWTMARERLNVTVIVFANAAYRILEIEYQRTGSGTGSVCKNPLFSLSDPKIDWCAMAQAHGVAAYCVEDAQSFDRALAEALATAGPNLIEARLP